MSVYDSWKTHDEFAEAAARDDLARERWLEETPLADIMADVLEDILLEVSVGNLDLARKMAKQAIDQAWVRHEG